MILTRLQMNGVLTTKLEKPCQYPLSVSIILATPSDLADAQRAEGGTERGSLREAGRHAGDALWQAGFMASRQLRGTAVLHDADLVARLQAELLPQAGRQADRCSLAAVGRQLQRGRVAHQRVG